MNNICRIRYSHSQSGNFQFKIETRKLVGIVVLVIAFATCGAAAQAQQSTKIPRLGILELASPPAAAEGHKALQQGLRELGYIEGKNVILEYRYANGKLDLLSALAAELVGLKVDVIVTRSTGSIRAAMNATQTIPIVFPSAGAPVEDGIVASLASPGGNVTGLTQLSAELREKARHPQANCVRTSLEWACYGPPAARERTIAHGMRNLWLGPWAFNSIHSILGIPMISRGSSRPQNRQPFKHCLSPQALCCLLTGPRSLISWRRIGFQRCTRREISLRLED